MTSPGYDIVPNTDEGQAYTADTVSGAAEITEASAYSVMNADVTSAFGSFGVSSSTGLATTAASIGSTTWGTAVNNAATSALSGATTANASIATVSSGVSANVTGAVATTTPAGVGPAVQLLNATVQASGSAPQVEIFNQNGTWTQPSGLVTANLMMVAAGGGGAQGGMSTTTGAAGGGGGAGAYSLYNGIPAASLPTSAAVVVPVGGSGGFFSGVSFGDTFQRANSSSLGSSWRTDSGTNSSQILSNLAQAVYENIAQSENGCWNTYLTPFDTDNCMVEAQLAAPSTSLATNNFTGVYLAAPNSYSSSSLTVLFVGDAAGCKIITQSNAPASGTSYVASGSGTGQTTRASTSSYVFGTTPLIKLIRLGNTFVGYVNGTVALTWVDSGNLVPTGSSNRLCGFVQETNYPTLQQQYSSPAISSFQAADIPGWSNPGGAGGNATFNGTSYVAPGGAGGVGGGTDASGTTRPSSGSFLNTDLGWTGASGTGNQANTAAGGVGAAGVSGYSPNGTQGGAGYNTSGGLPGTATSLAGAAGTGPTGGAYAPASGGGGGFYVSGSTGQAGQGGAGGFPGGGGAGGGATVDALGTNGLGGPGADGQIVVTSNFT